MSPYQQATDLALKVRDHYRLSKVGISLTSLRSIYKAEGIKIHYTGVPVKNLRAAYFNDDCGCDVIVNKRLPNEPKIFSLAHELKHHYLDRKTLSEMPCCKRYDEEPLIEKTAEVFAAELIWPKHECRAFVEEYLQGREVDSKMIVHLKKECGVPVSYSFLVKRLDWYDLINASDYADVKFQNLEYQLYGKPFYLR